MCAIHSPLYTHRLRCEVEVGGSRTSFLARHTVGRSADRVVKSNSSGSNVSGKGQLLLLFFSCLDKLPKWISKSSDPKPFGAHGQSFDCPQKRQHFKINNTGPFHFFSPRPTEKSKSTGQLFVNRNGASPEFDFDPSSVSVLISKFKSVKSNSNQPVKRERTFSVSHQIRNQRKKTCRCGGNRPI